MTRGRLLGIALTLLVGGVSCAGPTGNIEAVGELDLERYDGVWYDVGSFPQTFQEGCHCTTATYTLRDDGNVGVLNACRKGSVDGEEDTAEARAFRPDDAHPGELKVEFFWPFAADYWVIYLEDGPEQYELAFVSEPTQEYLWILSRTPTLSEERWQTARSWLEEKAFDLDRLGATVQEGCWD